ncbi:MAG: hypothetical protein IRY97_09870, partial [Thermomicrobiaceae bacterium]|nr:hypothetical protein [Thermomicrobiaceae bacterium]
IPFAVTAAASGVLAGGLTVAGVAADRRPGDWVWTAAVWLALAGLAESAILGFFYKIATFLVWLHRYAPVAGRQRVPRLESLYGRRLAVAGWALWVAAQGSAIAAIVAGWLWLGHVAGVVATAALGCFLVNVARIGSHWWSGRATDVWLTGFVARARGGSRSAGAREG